MFGFGGSNSPPTGSNNLTLEQQQIQTLQMLEIEMMQDMYSKMMDSCHKKCVKPHYAESELGKGEAVCLDR